MPNVQYYLFVLKFHKLSNLVSHKVVGPWGQHSLQFIQMLRQLLLLINFCLFFLKDVSIALSTYSKSVTCFVKGILW